jgi:hypothetical protein
MTASQVRSVLTVLLVLLLAGATVLTVRRYAWLDQRGLGGLAIAGLTFSAIAILGIFVQLGADLSDDAPPNQVLRQFLIYVLQMVIFIPTSVGGIWLVLRAVAWLLTPALPQAAAGLISVLAFLGYVAGVIKLLTWLSDRGIVGGA